MSRAYTYLLWTIAVALIATGWIVVLIGIHDAGMPEDLTTVWMCHHMGNELCGPETPWIQFTLSNLIHGWDQVILFWWTQWYNLIH